VHGLWSVRGAGKYGGCHLELRQVDGETPAIVIGERRGCLPRTIVESKRDIVASLDVVELLPSRALAGLEVSFQGNMSSVVLTLKGIGRT
jgi:hypothetical protein